jgi:hypothetical protein
MAICIYHPPMQMALYAQPLHNPHIYARFFQNSPPGGFGQTFTRLLYLPALPDANYSKSFLTSALVAVGHYGP